jgi:hypothetical protein
MATKTPKAKAPKAPKPAVEPDFMTAMELTAKMGVADTKTLDKAIAAGTVPPPWFWFGPRKRLWRRDHYLAMVATGRWPKDAFKRD